MKRGLRAEEAVLRLTLGKQRSVMTGRKPATTPRAPTGSLSAMAALVALGALLVAPAGASAAGQGQASQGPACSFEVVHNDHIGRFAVPKGTYQITLLDPDTVSCGRAGKAFATFLQDFDGRLPRPWKLNNATGTFTRGVATIGFRVKRMDRTPNPGRGVSHLAKGSRKCPGTFEVENNDRVGKLPLPRGPYFVFVFKGSGLSCPAAERRFAGFLDRPNGMLPRPWIVIGATGTFRNGTRPGFKVKPASVR